MTNAPDVRILRAADRTAEAWKNGGGVTRQIAAGACGSGTGSGTGPGSGTAPGSASGDFGWRVSLAEVAADGPFSVFPGVDRTLTLAEGAGMDLTVDGVPRLVDERYAPQRFPGDAATGCRLLAGPVVNFNVMYRRDTTRAEVAVVRGDLALTAPPGGGALLVVSLAGPVSVEGAHTDRVGLGTYDALLATGGEQGVLHLGAEGRAAVVRFTPAG
ncbi:HutD family protein [Streptomyces sp. NBC_00536]|uniref:HutD/Ves family protein n=1 Tax=Streptomyces sp. NBC_00536 TaxID=2975769 RepID=UPI002E802F1A|nr:HutD family protein [Streptomyces sp. NBC_00536]WUC82715.1 HutD family protein [Streptomyces sp. NBC_00536]